MPRLDTMVDRFRRLVHSRPRHPVLLGPEAVCTAEALDRLAADLQRVLEGAGLRPGQVVGLDAPGGVPFLAGLLALRRAGLVVLLLDAGTPPREQDRLAGRLGAAALLSAAAPWDATTGRFRVRRVHPAGATPLPPETAVLKLTSGSSGEPRGIACSEEVLAADDDALRATMGITAADRLLSAIPLSHSYGFASLALPALRAGLPLVVPARAGPLAPLQAAAACGATVFPTAPAYLRAVLNLSAPPEWPAGLRKVVAAGAPLPPADAVAFRERFGLPVHVFYGASECGGICYDPDGDAAIRGTVGRPVDGVQVTLEAADPDSPTSAQGRVVIRSAAVAAGYVPQGDPRLSGGSFRSDDLGRMSSGELVLQGRLGDWINVDGRKVNPREIEALLRSLDGVHEAVVFGRPAPGRAGRVLEALVAGDPDRLTPEAVRRWCQEHLPRHKRPRGVRVVREIPRTGRGKIDRAAAAALAGGLPAAAGPG